MNEKENHSLGDDGEKISKAINILDQLAELRSSNRLHEQSRSLQVKLADFIFNLVVIGEFKRGKSTLINALLGAAVLPTSTVPLTSVATVVRYGNEAKAKISLRY